MHRNFGLDKIPILKVKTYLGGGGGGMDQVSDSTIKSAYFIV